MKRGGSGREEGGNATLPSLSPVVGVCRDRAVGAAPVGRFPAEPCTAGRRRGSQDYRFEYNPQAEDQVFTLRQNGAWVQKGQPMNSGVRLAIGYRDEYYDFTF